MATIINGNRYYDSVWTATDSAGTISGTTSISTTDVSLATEWITGEENIVIGSGIMYEPIQYGMYETVSGTQIQFDFVQNDKKVIHPRLYFRFVKSKLLKLEERKLNKRLLLLQKFVKSAEDLDQQGLYEEFARKIAITVREQELWACGIEYFLHREDVLKYMDRVKDVEIGFVKLEKYDRPVPTQVEKKIKRIKKLKLFDELWVLHLNYKDKLDVTGKTKKEEKLKTNKEKIKEKDPIIFGIQNYMPDKLYYVIDWIDEYCDLTLDKFIDDLKLTDPDYDVDKFDDIDEDYIQKLVAETRDRYNRLQKTNMNNYKSLMEEEDLITKGKKISKKVNSSFTQIKNKIRNKWDEVKGKKDDK